MADVVFESPAPPAQVLSAIAESGREWRESVIPPELRRELRYRVRAHVAGDRFWLQLPSQSDDVDDLVLNGAVYPAPGGGSIVRASFSSSQGFWLAMAAAGFVVVFWSLGWGLLLLAGGLASMAHGHWRMTRRRAEGTTLTRYLTERLRAAIPDAASAESPVAVPES